MWKFPKDKTCYLVVLGGFLIELSLGSFYSVESIDLFLIKFMNKSSTSKGYVNEGNTVWVLGLIAFGVGASISAGGILAENIGSPMAVLIGGWIMSLNVALTYYTIHTYISVVAISYGLFSGIGTGLSYGVAFGAPCKWFPNNIGLIIGIVVSGFAISGAIFTRIQFAVIYTEGVRNLGYLPISFIVLGLCYAFLQFLGSLLIKDKPENDEEISTVNSATNEFTQSSSILGESKCLLIEQIELNTHQLLVEFDFWILWLTMFINTSSLLVFQHLYLKFGQYYYKNSDASFELLTTIGSISNSLGRIFWGYLVDRKSYKFVMVLNILPLALFLSTFPALLSIHNGHAFYYVYGLWISVINVCLAGTYVVFPAMSAKLYGLKHFVSNYGFLFTSSSVSSMIICIIISSSWHTTDNGPMLVDAYIIAGVILLISAGLTFIFRGKSLILNRF